ncbi:MAG: hypothetical protein IMW94_10490 [Thermoanaerobacter sp.]|nr:hypothetical protein [Thermoanaerobacter sp.]
MQINWEAWGVIGQWAGAIATFLAVYVAVKQGKPKVKVRADVYEGWAPNPFTGKAEKIFTNRLYVTAVNIGTVPVKIVNMGFRLPGKHRYAIINPEPGVLPKVLMPSEEVSIWTDEQSLREKWNTDFAIAFASDSAGRIYYQHVGLKKEITRFIRWNIGKIKNN